MANFFFPPSPQLPSSPHHHWATPLMPPVHTHQNTVTFSSPCPGCGLIHQFKFYWSLRCWTNLPCPWTDYYDYQFSGLWLYLKTSLFCMALGISFTASKCVAHLSKRITMSLGIDCLYYFSLPSKSLNNFIRMEEFNFLKEKHTHQSL